MSVSVLPARRPARWRLGSRQTNEAILGLVLVAPLMLWLASCILYPLVSAVNLSFQDVGIIGTGGSFVGLDNYAFILKSGGFWAALGRSVIWTVANGALQTVAAFVAALILKQHFRGQSIARVWVIVSWIVPTVVVAIIWRWILGTSGGIVNYLLLTLGVIPSPIGFFGTSNTAFASTILINSWRWFPFMTVIVLAGMQSIPEEFYEAASVDGASSWQKFANVTLPGLQPVLFVMGLIGTLWSVNVFDTIFLMTGGGPASASTTLPVFIYVTAFKGYQLSRAAAASVIVGLILVAFVLAFLRWMPSPTDEEAYR
ncbi:MAG: sugar ABC transporter permease [Chloroflexi bacterium]|nr:sugar ABC transporter permease [Chloroflexota bacterium]